MPTPGTVLQPPSLVPSATTDSLSSGAGVTRPSTSAKKKRGVKASPELVYPLVLVEWDDHHNNNVWLEPAELDSTPAKFMTVGWLVKEDDVGMVLAMAILLDDKGQPAFFTNTFTILKTLIRKRTLVRSAPRTQP